MKKQKELHSEQSIENIAFTSTLGEHPAVQWIAEHGKMILYVLLGMLLAFFIFSRLFFGGSSSSEKDFYEADKNFTLFQQSNDSKGNEAFAHLNRLLKKHPELHAKYDGLIAQTFIDRNEAAEAQKFALPAIERTKSENHPFYSSFAQTTLLISENKYSEALTQSRQLKEEMIKHSSEKKELSHLLFALNLLRIGMLEKQTGEKSEELKTWQEWKQYASTSDKSLMDAQTFQTVNDIYQEGKISLLNYIESREKLLN